MLQNSSRWIRRRARAIRRRDVIVVGCHVAPMNDPVWTVTYFCAGLLFLTIALPVLVGVFFWCIYEKWVLPRLTKDSKSMGEPIFESEADFDDFQRKFQEAKSTQNKTMKKPSPFTIVAIGIAMTICYAVTGCQNMTPGQAKAINSATKIAEIAATAAATYFGGPAAGQLASETLQGYVPVVQAYVGNTIPPEVVKATAGNAAIGTALAQVIAPDHVVPEQNVATITKAAAIAATLAPALTP